jgi:pyruvate/2-oxoglutarate/acetoin dehydrogenase E1 component
VIGIDARAIAAEVVDLQTIRDRADKDCITEPVSKQLDAVHFYHWIASAIFGALPEPAPSIFVNIILTS